MTTARNALPSKISLTAPPVDLSFSPRSNNLRTNKHETTHGGDNGWRTTHHGTYGGRAKSSSTPYLIASPPVSTSPEDSQRAEAIIERPRRLYRRRTDDIDFYSNNNVKQDVLHDDYDDDDDNDDDGGESSWSQGYDVQTLSTIPEVPSTLPGTLTTSAILEIGQTSRSSNKRTLGNSLAKIFSSDRWRKAPSSATSVVVKKFSKHVEDEEMRDFRYQQASVVHGRMGQGEQNGAFNRQSSTASSSSTPDMASTSTPSVDDDCERLASLQSAASKRKRKLRWISVAIVISVVCAIVLVAVVLSVVFSSEQAIKRNATMSTSLRDNSFNDARMTSSYVIPLSTLLLFTSTEFNLSIIASTESTSTSTLATQLSARKTSSMPWSSVGSTLQVEKVSTLLEASSVVLTSGTSSISAALRSSEESTPQAIEVSTPLDASTDVLISIESITSAPNPSSSDVSTHVPLSAFVASVDMFTSSTDAIATTTMQSTAIDFSTYFPAAYSDVTGVNELYSENTTSEATTVTPPPTDIGGSLTTNVTGISQSSPSEPTTPSPSDENTTILNLTAKGSAL